MAKKGTHLSDEAKAKISIALLGRRCCMKSEYALGHTPWNKGTKGIMKPNKTSFKKGQKPKNYMGGYKVCKDGIYVRVGDKTYSYDNGKRKVGKYEQLARVKYRKAFGDFNKNLIVFHKDKDMMNNEIDNLELISRAELMKRNIKPIKKNCFICGKEFLARISYNKTCSKKCYKENCKILNKLYNQRNKEKVREYKRKYKEKCRILRNTNTYTISQ